MKPFPSLLFLASAVAFGQMEADPHAGHHMPASSDTVGHNHALHDHAQMHEDDSMNAAERYLMTMTSGTAVNPQSWPMPMLMPRAGSWNFMLMGQGFLVNTQQSGPRGADKLYSANWAMGSATRRLGKGALMVQTMFSLDPASVTGRRYPLLFQTGETAYGRPLVDAQHPHDFFMGLGVHYTRLIGENAMIQGYYAPVGDVALGPVAFPHRASAMELPQATLSHHMQDSTHIASNVVTAAIHYRRVRLEMSGFNGTEPDENRWVPDWGPMDSYAGRLSVFPGRNWMAQYSMGRMPGHHSAGDLVRSSASIHYTKPMGAGNAWSTSVIWGRNHDTFTQRNLDGFVVESLYPITRNDFITGRAEIAEKDDLFADVHQHTSQFAPHLERVFRIQSYTAGYTRDLPTPNFLQTGLGANFTAYAIPSALTSRYGERPWGVSVFVRIRLKSRG